MTKYAVAEVIVDSEFCASGIKIHKVFSSSKSAKKWRDKTTIEQIDHLEKLLTIVKDNLLVLLKFLNQEYAQAALECYQTFGLSFMKKQLAKLGIDVERMNLTGLTPIPKQLEISGQLYVCKLPE